MRWRVNLVCVSLVLVVLGGLALPVSAQSGSTAIAQGFQTEAKAGVVAGALVSVKSGDPRVVELATTDSAQRLLGVAAKNPLVSLSNGKNEVQVVLSGSTNVLVSDINGAIRAGDKITASPIEGVGMLAASESQIVGTTQASFDVKAATTKTVRDRSGKEHTVHVGQVALQVNVAYYQPPSSTFLPPFIQNLANVLAGRPVSLVRIGLSGLIVLIGLIGFIVLVTTAARSSIASMGRNPLAAKSIHRGLVQAIVVALLVAAAALLAGYVILRV